MVFVHNTVDFVKNGVYTADGVHNTVDGVNKWDKGRKQQRLPGSSWSTQPYSRQQAQSFLWFFREFLWNDDFKIFLGLLLADGASTVQWGGGRLFDASAEFFFTKTFVTRKWKVEKSIPRWEMNRPSEDYKRAVSKIWGRKAKNGFSGRKPSFRVQKKYTSGWTPCSRHDQAKLCKQKSTQGMTLNA